MSVRRSLAWTYSAQIINFCVSFGTSVILARLVSPREFGIFGMASAASAILNLFFAFSLSTYIIRETDVDSRLLRSAFTVNAALTLVLVTLIYLSGWAATIAFGAPEVGEFLRLFAIVPFISMFEFIPNALCARDMRFGTMSLIGVLRIASISSLTIILAYAGLRHMSFAWAAVGSAIATMVTYNVIAWRPDVWRLRFKGFREIVSFGLQMMSINGLSQLAGRAGEIVVGSLLGLRSLGLYNRASSLGAQVYANVYGIGASVVFSKMSRDLRETGSFHDTFLKALSILLAVVWPMMLGIAVLSQPLVRFLYGPNWQTAAGPLSLIMIAYFIALGVGMNWEVFVLRQRTELQFKIEVTRSTTGFILFCLGCLINLEAAAAAK